MSAALDRGEEVRWNAERGYLERKRSGAVWTPIRIASSSPGASGDSITVNGSAVTDADFDDATPAAPAGSLNVKWQKDASSPANVSAYVKSDNASLEISSSALRRAALTGDVTASAGSNTTAIGANKVLDTMLRDSAAISVIGRSVNSSGDPGDIAATTSGDVLRLSGTTLGFGTITSASISGLSAAVYTDDLPASGVSLDAQSEDFQATQANSRWTTQYDIGTVGVTKSIVARGLQIDFPSGAGSTKIAGYYNATAPTGWGSSDFAVAARICMHGGLSATGAGGLALLQDPSSSTGDIYFGGYISTTGANQYSAEVGSLTAYNAGALTGIFGSGSGPSPELYVLMRISSAFHITTYIGATQDTLTLAQLDNNLAWNSASRLALIGWGINRKVRFVFPYVRIIPDTYPGATYDFPPRISGARYFAL